MEHTQVLPGLLVAAVSRSTEVHHGAGSWFLGRLVDIQYSRNDIDFSRGAFRVRGDTVEVCPAYTEDAVRVEFFGDQIERLTRFEPLTGEATEKLPALTIYPGKQFVTPADKMKRAAQAIREELTDRIAWFEARGKLLEAQRIKMRTEYDLEMMLEMGFCSGIENYSRHIAGRPAGSRPTCIIDFFPRDYLLIIDESHATIPQLKAMYNGDRQRKETLVEHGFRLPSALDNRPLKFEEFEKMWNQTVFVSATPSKYEMEKTGGEIVEQIIRPTGLVDPIIEVKPAQGQVPHLLSEIKIRAEKGERVLVTTLTKRLAEDLSAYIQEAGIRGRYLHSEIQTLERVEILKDLRQGDFDVLVGVNLLREGLDLPEVSMVAILDADKAGFLRSETSIIQMIGRSARNVNATVYLYADTITPAMQKAIDETARRRTQQLKFNADHNITPTTIVKAIRNTLESEVKARKTVQQAIHATGDEVDRTELIKILEEEMLECARNLEFERAAQLRDKLSEIKGSPMIQSAGGPVRDNPDQKIWQPRSKGRPKRNLAK